MASFGKVLDLLDDRYLQLQDVIGNVEPLPTLVPYERYIQTVLVYRMDTDHEIFMGLLQDFTMRRAIETRKEFWTWLVQWEVDKNPPVQPIPSPKKVRLDAPQANMLPKSPSTPHRTSALTIFERRTLDGALMLEEELLRILIDIVQVGSSLVPNFVEFLYRWIDYYEGDGKALKAALAWEIPSLWDFEYHPLLLPQEDEIRLDKKDAGNTSNSNADELRQSSPTKKMGVRPKPDLAAIELSTFHSEESERLKYREVKFGIQPPKVELPLPPLINIPRDSYKRIKYYAACFKSRQRALYLLLEAGLTTRQINNYQKLQTIHPKETSEAGDANGLRNYQKDARFAQAHFELKEKQIKQREISISNKLAVEAELAASHAVPDGANGLPLIPPTPSHNRKTGMETALLRRLQEISAKNKHKVRVVPAPLLGRLRSKVFENSLDADTNSRYDLTSKDEDSESVYSGNDDSDSDDEDATTAPAFEFPMLPPSGLPRPLPPRPVTATHNAAPALGGNNSTTGQSAPITPPSSAPDQSIPPNITAYLQNLTAEQAQRLVPLIEMEREHLRLQSALSQNPISSNLEHASPPNSVQHAYIASMYNASSLPRYLSAQQPPNSYASVYQTSGMDQTSETNSSPSLAGPSMPLRDHTLGPRLSGFGLQDGQNQSFSDPHRSPATEGNRGIPNFAFPPRVFGPSIPTPQGFGADYFGGSRRQQEAAQSTTTQHSLVPSSQPTSPPGPSPAQVQPPVFPSQPQQMPSQGQQLFSGRQGMSASFAAMTAAAHFTRTSAGPSSTQSPYQPQGQSSSLVSDQRIPTEPRGLAPLATLRPLLTLSPPSPQRQPPVQLPVLPSSHSLQVGNQASAGHFSSSTLQPPPSGSMLPTARSGIARNAPSPLPIQPQSPSSSAFTTFNSEVLATSPFLSPSLTRRPPIQIYFPRVVVPGNEIGPGGSAMGNKGCIETDALILGHEDVKTGALVLSKVILLPMGVWENTVRRAGQRHYSVLETYPHPSIHPDKQGKGKEKVDENVSMTDCHRAAYDKLVYACGLINATPRGREDELTKRWRVNKGPMTSSDRGAVWEGWGVYVDREIQMTASERRDALRFKEGFWPYSSAEEAEQRRKEIDEMIEEDEAMGGDDGM